MFIIKFEYANEYFYILLSYMCVCTNVLILFILFDSDVLDEIIPTMLFPKCR